MKIEKLFLIALVAGCATASSDERQSLLADPVNCSVAEADIAALQAAMPSRGERAGSAVRTLSPVGAATSILTGTYLDRASVLIGRTEGELTARIEEIEETCGISAMADPAE